MSKRTSVARREILLGLATLGAGAGAARAQPGWPVRQTRIVVPFAAGSTLDLPTRILADRLSRKLNSTFFVENKPGAGGGLGSMEVVRAPADGSALLSGSNSITILPFIQPRLGLDPIRDLAPVSLLMDMPVGVIVRAESPIRDMPDLIARARAAPGRITYGSGGVGSAVHLSTALFASMAGIELMHVPYSGGARVVSAILAGDVDLMFASTIDLIPLMRQGQARGLGVASTQRLASIPAVPLVSDFVPGYTMLQWVALFAPKATPPTLIAQLADELAAMRGDPDLNARITAGESVVRFDGPAPLAARLEQDIAMWREVIRRENIRAE